MNLNVVSVVCRLHVLKGAFAYLLLHRLEFLVIRLQVDQHGALAGAVERQVWVCTYEQIFAREIKMFNSTKIIQIILFRNDSHFYTQRLDLTDNQFHGFMLVNDILIK